MGRQEELGDQGTPHKIEWRGKGISSEAPFDNGLDFCKIQSKKNFSQTKISSEQAEISKNSIFACSRLIKVNLKFFFRWL